MDTLPYLPYLPYLGEKGEKGEPHNSARGTHTYIGGLAMVRMYRGFRIEYDPMPFPGALYHWYHPDHDGSPDAAKIPENRGGYARTVELAMGDIADCLDRTGPDRTTIQRWSAAGEVVSTYSVRDSDGDRKGGLAGIYSARQVHLRRLP